MSHIASVKFLSILASDEPSGSKMSGEVMVEQAMRHHLDAYLDTRFSATFSTLEA